MTITSSLYRVAGRAPWGLFSNLTNTNEPFVYIYIHFAGRQIGIHWERFNEEEAKG